MTLSCLLFMACFMKRRACSGSRPNDGADPTTTSGFVSGPLAAHREADANWPRGPTSGVMKALNFEGLPPVASASSAPEASGVCRVGTAVRITSPSSRARRPSRRFSLWS